MGKMGKASVGGTLAIASLLVLLLTGATLSDGERDRGELREETQEEEKEELPIEALKYLGRFGHLQPPNGPFSLVGR